MHVFVGISRGSGSLRKGKIKMDASAAKLIGAGISVIALFGVGMGLGNLFSSLINAIARNPSAKNDLISTGMLCFALIESLALLAFVVAMIILFTA